MGNFKKKIPNDKIAEFEMFSIFKDFSLLPVQLRLKVNKFLTSWDGIGGILNKSATQNPYKYVTKRSYKSYICSWMM